MLKIKRPSSPSRFSFAIKVGFVGLCFIHFYSIYRMHLFQIFDSDIHSVYNWTLLVGQEEGKEDGSSSLSLSSLMVMDKNKGWGFTWNSQSRPSLHQADIHDESQVFEDIERRIMTRNKICGSAPREPVYNNQSSFVSTFVHAYANAKVNANDKQQGGLHCQLPSPDKTCVLGYTAIVSYKYVSGLGGSSGGTDAGTGASHRILFMNLLSLLAKTFRNNAQDSSGGNKHDLAEDIVIILVYDGSVQDLQGDKAYGKRILDWHQEGIIRLMYRSDLIENFGPLYLFDKSFMDRIPHDFVIYLDGTLPLGGLMVENAHDTTIKDHNYDDDNAVSIMDSLSVGFELLQQNPQLLVGFHADGFKIGDFNNYIMLGNSNVTAVKNSNTANLTNFLPICNDDNTGIHSNNNGTLRTAEKMQDTLLQFMRLSGTFVHRNYLCFMWHETFRPLRQMIQSIHHQYTLNDTATTDNTTTHSAKNYNILIQLHSIFLSSVICQLSGKLPLLYPLVKASWKGQDRSQNLKNQRRRLDDMRISHLGDIQEETDEDEEIDDDDWIGSSPLLPRRRPRHYIHPYFENIIINNNRNSTNDDNHDDYYNDDTFDKIMRHRKLYSQSLSSFNTTSHNNSYNNITVTNSTNNQVSFKIQDPNQQRQQEQNHQKQHSPSQLTSEIIASIVSYFGTHTRGIMCWCLKSLNDMDMNGDGDATIGTQTACKKICHRDTNNAMLSRGEIPWMVNDPERSKCHGF